MHPVISETMESVKDRLRYLRHKSKVPFCIGRQRLCPVCGKWSSRFCTYGATPREEAQCAHCGSLERHRLLWLFLERKTTLFDGQSKQLLHVAPEACLKTRLHNHLGSNYLSADLYGRRAMVKMDITEINYPDRSFDAIYCSHVLEHVPDDRKAMREFRRTLKDDGWAILLVPITAERTLEDPSITDPEERLRIYGQRDHVRRYGPDYADRLREEGFQLEVFQVRDIADRDEAAQMGLNHECGDIYFCTK